MKAFEDYWDFTGLGEHVHYVPDVEKAEQFLVEGINRKEERREGWRDALKWARSTAVMDYDANGLVIYPDVIDKELKAD